MAKISVNFSRGANIFSGAQATNHLQIVYSSHMWLFSFSRVSHRSSLIGRLGANQGLRDSVFWEALGEFDLPYVLTKRWHARVDTQNTLGREREHEQNAFLGALVTASLLFPTVRFVVWLRPTARPVPDGLLRFSAAGLLYLYASSKVQAIRFFPQVKNFVQILRSQFSFSRRYPHPGTWSRLLRCARVR